MRERAFLLIIGIMIICSLASCEKKATKKEAVVDVEAEKDEDMKEFVFKFVKDNVSNKDWTKYEYAGCLKTDKDFLDKIRKEEEKWTNILYSKDDEEDVLSYTVADTDDTGLKYDMIEVWIVNKDTDKVAMVRLRREQ